ncbi:hypothetical protein [Streptomyces antibioticus]|uniref:hypothetical protein n=1 Tax=Streptomyces antibioticus TaxID=1890 RepID=UPI0036FCCB60
MYVGTRKRNAADAVERRRLWQQQVTHCPQGHPYNAENTAIKPTGARRCRACAREQDKRRRAGRTTCHKGHELSGDNVLLCRNGTRKCHICDRARNEARRQNH